MARKTEIQYIRLYTQGSAARKLEPVTPWKTAKLPKVRKQKRLVVHIDPVATVGIVVAAVMLILMAVGFTRLRAAQQQTAVMEQYVETLRNNNEVLQDTYDAVDLEAVEEMALALGMVPADQVQKISISVPVTVEAEEPGTWEQIRTFLTGLFA